MVKETKPITINETSYQKSRMEQAQNHESHNHTKKKMYAVSIARNTTRVFVNRLLRRPLSTRGAIVPGPPCVGLCRHSRPAGRPSTVRLPAASGTSAALSEIRNPPDNEKADQMTPDQMTPELKGHGKGPRQNFRKESSHRAAFQPAAFRTAAKVHPNNTIRPIFFPELNSQTGDHLFYHSFRMNEK